MKLAFPFFLYVGLSYYEVLFNAVSDYSEYLSWQMMLVLLFQTNSISAFGDLILSHSAATNEMVT